MEDKEEIKEKEKDIVFSKRAITIIIIISILAMFESVRELNILSYFGWFISLVLSICTHQDLKNYEKKFKAWLQKNSGSIPLLKSSEKG